MNNMWDQEKKAFIDKLSAADGTFNKILNEIDSEHLVINGSEREKLEECKNANKRILDKLNSREFTVSVVGLEKAGKSTLGNALIKSMVLPEYSERCTYTTTEIRSGNTDVAEVYFYTREEFNKNFKMLLNEVEYPDTVDFATMTLEAFQRYWQAVETHPKLYDIFKVHGGTTAEDIKTMLEGKQKILPLLGRAPKNFGSDAWNNGEEFNEFKSYITGISGKNADGTANREPYPYAVKNVIIRSTQLADMSHLVLYDVPGFDSPTALHKKQTEKMLKESDAIILVTNIGGNPNLSGPQLTMLRKERDPDGINLSEKAFVFGNKMDTAPSVETARNNFAVLRKESVNKYQIAASNHIIGGSARAYLEKEGFIGGDAASKKMDEWHLDYGVKELLEKMQDYYDNDRFAVLKKRAENTLSETRKILQETSDKYKTGEFTDSDFGMEIMLEIQSKLSKFIQKANPVAKTYNEQIISEAPFTNALKNDIENIYPFVNDENGHLKLIQEMEDNSAIDPDKVYSATTIDGNVREKLGKNFVENIVKSASKLTLDKQTFLRQTLIDEFLKIMGMEDSTPYKEELTESVNKLFADMLIEGGSECNFNSLVERFVNTLIQTVIGYPFASEERRNKVKENLAELVSLSVYYNMPDKSEQEDINLSDMGTDGMNFFTKILVHEGIVSENEDDIDASENENFLRNLFAENKQKICEGASFFVDVFPFGKWAKLALKAGINLAALEKDTTVKKRDKLDSKLEDLFYSGSKWTSLSQQQREQAVEEVIRNYIVAEKESESAGTFISQLNELHERALKVKRPETKEDMISMLDADIKILRDITEKAVIKAIGLERAFTSVTVKNVELIRENLQNEEGNEAFRKWIISNAAKLMPSKFASVNESKAMNENRKAIVNAIDAVLNKTDF